MRKFLSRALRFLLFLFLSSVFVITLLLLGLPFFLEREFAKQFIGEQASTALQRTVSFDGLLSLRLGLTPALELHDLHISNPKGFPENSFLQVGSIFISLPLRQDFRKAPYPIDAIEGKNIALTIAQDASGKSNLEFSSEEQAKKKVSTEPSPLPNISRIHLSHFEIIFLSQNSSRHVLHFQDLLVENLGSSQSARLQMQGKFDGKNFQLKTHINPIRLGKNTKWWLRDLSAQFMDASLAGKIEFAQASKNITAELKADNINVPSWREHFGAAGEKSEVESALAGTPPETPNTRAAEPEFRLPFEILQSFLADVKLDIGKLNIAPDQSLDNISLHVRNTKEGLHIDTFRANLLGGEFLSTGFFSPELSQVNIEGKHLGFNPLTKLAGGEQMLDGLFQLKLDLKSKGQTQEELIKNSEGEFLISSEHAQLRNSKVQAVSAGLMNILSPLFKAENTVQVPCFLMNFLVTHGKAHSKAQVLRLDDVFFFGKGSIDFAEMEISNNFSVQSASPALASLIPPFRMSGPLAGPSFTPSISGTLASLTDSAEGALLSPLALAKQTAQALGAAKAAEGLESCREALEKEKSLLSSQIGGLFE